MTDAGKLVVPDGLGQRATLLSAFGEEMDRVRNRLNDLITQFAGAAGEDDMGHEFLANVQPPMDGMNTLAEQGGELMTDTHVNLGLSSGLFDGANEDAAAAAHGGFEAP